MAQTIPPPYRGAVEIIDTLARQDVLRGKRAPQKLAVIKQAAATLLPAGEPDEGFWRYLSRQLGAKGGIQQGRFRLYLAEYVWRYNHGQLSPERQARELFKLIRQD